MNRITIFILCAVLVVVGAGYFVFSQNVKMVPIAHLESSTVGVSDTEIVLGSSSPLSGPTMSLGTNLISGARVAINEINDAGGINGRKLRMISYDDQYDPPHAVENTQKLINEDKVFALSNYVGTPTGVKVAPLVAEAKIPLVGMFTGAEAFRSPVQPYIFNVRGSYYQETELAVKYFVDSLGLKKISVFYQADAFGLAGLDGAKLALTKRGLTPVALASYERNTTNVESAVSTILDSDSDAVIMIGTYSPLAKFVGLVKAKKPSMLFHTVSFVGPEAFVKELKGNTSNVYVTQVVPPVYEDPSFPGVGAYINGLKKYDASTTPTFGGLEGYINTKVLAEGIRLAGSTLTRESLVNALESITNYDAGIGATVSFSKTNHQGLNTVYLTGFNNNKFVLIPVK